MAEHKVVAGAFASEEEILAAALAAREAGLAIHDAYTPFPVHGLDRALGLAPSPLPRLCFRFGAAGLLLTLSFQYWVSLFDWPMNIGGKSYNASPALVPIAFELTVLFAALGTVASFLRLRRMSPLKKAALFRLGGVDDRFVLALRVMPGAAEPAALSDFLRERGARDVSEAAIGP